MLWFPTPQARLAYTLAGLTWDIVLIGLMGKVLVHVMGWSKGLGVLACIVVCLVIEAYEKVNTPRE